MERPFQFNYGGALPYEFITESSHASKGVVLLCGLRGFESRLLRPASWNGTAGAGKHVKNIVPSQILHNGAVTWARTGNVSYGSMNMERMMAMDPVESADTRKRRGKR